MKRRLDPADQPKRARFPSQWAKRGRAAMLVMLVGCIGATRSTTPVHPDPQVQDWLESCAAVSSSTDEAALRIAVLDCHRAARALDGSPTATAQQQQLETTAAAGYETYLAAYPENPYASEVRYSYAELLYETEQFAAAWQEYDAVVEQDPSGARAKHCADSAIFAAQEVVEREAAAASDSEQTPMSEWEEKLVASLDRYAALYPDDAKSVSVIYKAGFILYQHQRFADSIERFRAVIALDPTGDAAIQASHLVLDSFVRQEDWAGLRDAALSFHEQPDLGDESYKQNIHSIYQRAIAKLEQ